MLRRLAVVLVILGLASWQDGGGLAAIFAVVRLVALAAESVALFALVTPDDIADALTAWRVPGQITLLLSGGLRFAPRVAQDFTDLRAAQEARGIQFIPFWRHVPAYLALLLPLLRKIMANAEQLAQALEARGFSAPGRTILVSPHWRFRDSVIVSIAITGCFLALVL